MKDEVKNEKARKAAITKERQQKQAEKLRLEEMAKRVCTVLICYSCSEPRADRLPSLLARSLARWEPRSCSAWRSASAERRRWHTERRQYRLVVKYSRARFI
jgi:hypothetical protein